MSEAFDPYYVWLGIPVGEQPPDHYRLLGVAQFESNAVVIRNAAEQRMRYLRTVTGPRAKRAQQLINEIVTAQRVLSEKEAREKYNALITESPLARRRPPPPPSTRPTAFEPPSIDMLDTRSHGRRSARTRGGQKKKTKGAERQVVYLGLWLSGVLGLVLLICVWFTTSNQLPVKAPTAREQTLEKFEKQRQANIEKAKLDKQFSDVLRNQQKSKKNPPAKSLKIPEEKSNPFSRALEKRATGTAEESKPESKPKQAEQQRSPGETAEEFLQSKGLVEGFNSTWKLENDLTKNLQQIRSSSGRIGVAAGPQYRSELKRRVVTKKTEIINRWLQLQRQPSDNGGPRDQEFAVLESWIYPTGLGPKVKDDIAVIQAIHREVNAEFKARAAANPLVAGLIADIRRAYASLAGDSRVQAALKTVGGTLAEPPEPTVNNVLNEQKEPIKAVVQATPPASTMPAMAELNRAQKALLDRAAADYRRATLQEFKSLYSEGRATDRFAFLALHHPDIPPGIISRKKKSPEPFLLEMRKAIWEKVRNTPAWKEASK